MNANLKRTVAYAASVIIVAAFMVMPIFNEELMTRDSMAVLGILIAAIVLWVLNVVHECAVALMMCSLFCALGHVPVKTVFGAFNGSVVWILIGAFALGAAMKRCGLLKRIALLLLKIFPKNYTGVTLGIMAVGAVVAPLVPSKNAKGAILGPVLRSVNDNMGYANHSKQTNGLALAFWTTTMLVPLTFVSGSTTTVASRELLPEEISAAIPMSTWMLGSLALIVPAIIIMAAFILFFYSPKKGEHVGNDLSKEFLDSKLAELGPMTRQEKITIVLTIVMVLYWIFKAHFGNIADWASCLLVIALLWFCGCLDAKAFRTEIAWENMFFIGICISLGSVLPSVGLSDWIVSILGPVTDIAFSSTAATIVVLTLLFFVIRFILISEGSFMSILCAVFYPLAVAAKLNPFVVAMILNVMACQHLLPYQSSAWLSCFYSFGDDAVDSKCTILYWCVVTVVTMISLFIGSFIWKAMGLWYL